jgi:hypothetical protein
MSRKVVRVCCFALFLASLILLGLARGISGLAQQSSRSTSPGDRKVTGDRIITTPCSEKKVRLAGQFQAQFITSRGPSGDTFLSGDFDAGRITAFGVTSGRKYEVNGTSHVDSRGPSPTEFTYVFNFALNKEKSFDSLMGHARFRIKLDARGQAWTEIIDVTIDCNN